MLRLLIGFVAIACSFCPCFGAEVCSAAAHAVETSLQAFVPPAQARFPRERISIANASAQHPAAGLDFGSDLSDETLKAFALTDAERASFSNAMRRIHKAGQLVMLDAIAGTAHCHSPLIFLKDSNDLKRATTPALKDPFDLCSYGGVALGEAGGTPFYAQTTNDFLDTDELKLFALRSGRLSEACTIAAGYQTVFEAVERRCTDAKLCEDFAPKVSDWAWRLWGSGSIDGPALMPATKTPLLSIDSDELPLLGATETSLVPEPFRFDTSASWYEIKGEPRVDFVRIGPAHAGPASMAVWEAYTLAALYKDGTPVASFVVERQRGPFREVQMYRSISAETTPAGLVETIYQAAGGLAGDYSNGSSMFADKHGRAYFSERLRTAINDMEQRTPTGDEGNLDFDPVTDSQDPSVIDLRVATESKGLHTAVVRASFHGLGTSPRTVLRYFLVKEAGIWKVDDIVALQPKHWRVSEIIGRR